MYVCVCIFFSIVWNTFWLGLASFFLDFIVMCHDTYLMMINYSESESHSVMSNSLQPHEPCSPWNSPGQNTGVGSLSLLQGIFSTQGSNSGLLHCRQTLYWLSHKGSPRILEWVAYPAPADLPDPGIELGSPALQANSLPTEILGKPSHRGNP